MPQREVPAHKGDAQSAIAHYMQIMQADPDSDEARRAHLEIGMIYDEQLGNHEKAIKIFEKIVQSYPTSPQAGEALWLLASHDYENGNYESARKRHLQFILDFSQDSRNQMARLRLAACYLHRGRHEEALKTYTDYEARYPTDSRIPAVLLKVGKIYEALNLPQKAEETYLRVIAEFPDATEETTLVQQRLTALRGAVNADAGTEQVPAAAEPPPVVDEESGEIRQVGPKTRPDASAELARWGTSPTFGYNPRHLLATSGLLEGEEMQATLAGDGALLDDAVYNMGLMFYMSEDYKRAGACLERAVGLGVRDANLYLKLGICYKKVGAGDKAKGTFRQLALIDMHAIEKLITLGEQEIEKKNYRAGIKSLKILQGISDEYDSHISQALRTAYHEIGDKAKADSYLQKQGEGTEGGEDSAREK